LPGVFRADVIASGTREEKNRMRKPDQAGTDVPQTFPQYLLLNARRFATRTAMRHKEHGIWKSWTWAQLLDEIRAFSLGLRAIGLKPGDKVAIVGQNRPRLYWSFAAVQALGAVPVPVYADSVAEEMTYVLNHAGVHFAICQDQEQVDKVLSMSDELTDLQKIVYDEVRGLRDYDHTNLHSIDAIEHAGREVMAAEGDEAWREGIAKGRGEDLAVMLYTSGTTGKPKGRDAVASTIWSSRRETETNSIASDRNGYRSRLSAVGLGGRSRVHLCAGLCCGLLRVLPGRARTRSTRTGARSHRSYFFAPPRVFENLLTAVMVRMEDADSAKKAHVRLFHGACATRRRTDPEWREGRALGSCEIHRLANCWFTGR
jgi:long-chain acyl-CoA synthetase